jgi:hypothetical protein
MQHDLSDGLVFILPSKRAAGPIAPARSKSNVEAAGNQKLTTVYFTNW